MLMLNCGCACGLLLVTVIRKSAWYLQRENYNIFVLFIAAAHSFDQFPD